MELHHQFWGKGDRPAIVILHGLLGSSRNWSAMAKRWQEQYDVFALDLRNHGDSFHADEMSYQSMTEDVRSWLSTHVSGPIFLLGHSMGGKVAMRLACLYPEMLSSLVVVDIAPIDYGLHNRVEFEAMQALPLEDIQSRKEADEMMGLTVKDWAMRQFLLTNLERTAQGAFNWKVNLSVLVRELAALSASSLDTSMEFLGKSLLLRGGLSDFVKERGQKAWKKHFPQGEIQTIEGVGHNPHIEKGGDFAAIIQNWGL